MEINANKTILSYNKEELQRFGKELIEMADDFDVQFKNSMWEVDLPTAEQLMMHDAYHKFELDSLGCTEEEFKNYVKMRGTYSDLEHFYDVEVEKIKQEMSYGYTREKIPYDINLTKEEAYAKYSEWDRETCRKSYELINKTKRKANLYEQEIRENYKGNLASQLGYNVNDYIERANKKDEEWKAAVANFQESTGKWLEDNKQAMEAFSSSMGDYNSFIKDTVAKYEEDQKSGFTL